MSEAIVGNIKVETYYSPFGGGKGKTFLSATVKLPTGDTLGVSQYTSEFPEWGCDSWFKDNGFPLWCNGSGSRDVRVRAVNPELRDLLNKKAESVTV